MGRVSAGMKVRFVSADKVRERAVKAGRARMASMTPEQRSDLAKMGSAGYLGKIPMEERRRIALLGVEARRLLMTKTERSEVGRKAAAARWGKCISS